MPEEATERRLHMVFDSVGDALIIYDRAGRIIDMNAQARELYGIAPGDERVATAGLSVEEIDFTRLHKAWQAAVAGKEQAFEWVVRRPADGALLDVEVHLKKVDVNGSAGILACIRDITEKKGTENALRESERRFRETLQTIPLPAVNIDRQGRITFINDCLLDLTGRDRTEVLGQDWFTLFIPPGQEITKIIFESGMRNGSIVNRFENDILTRSGERRYIAWANTPLRDANGTLVGISSIGLDLTERKKTEQLLMESEERHRVLYENNHAVMLLINEETGAIVDANPAAVSYYGYDPAELLSLNIDAISLLDKASRKDHFSQMRSRQVSVRIATQHRRADGTIRDVEADCTMVRLNSRRTVHAIIHDVTDRLLTERALKESQDRFRNVFDQSAEAILLARQETGEILYANAAITKILGVDTVDILWRPVSHLMHLFPGHDILDALRKLPEKRDIILPRITKPGPKDIIVSIRLRVISCGSEDLIHISFRDITDRILLEEEAKAAQAKLFHANKLSSLGILVSGIAHEINNPNNFMMFNSEMLSDIWQDVQRCLDEDHAHDSGLTLAGLPYDELREAVPKLLGGLVEGSRRIKNIIDGLRQFSRQDSGVRRQFDLNDTVLKATAMLTPEIKKHTEKFSLHLAEDVPPVTGRPEQIEQVIINLAINALQSLRTKKERVSIATYADEDYAVISISDDGCGMDVETLVRVSEPFFTTKEDAGGTGLGIFISQSIVAEHGGTLDFDSFKEEGTVATVKIPLSFATATGACP